MHVRIADEERIASLDILRGLALLGMLIVHFHQRLRLEVSGPEDLIPWAVWILLEQKSWGTFAFLFGAGFALLVGRLDARGVSVIPTYLRRLGMLALFGIVAGVGFGFHILFEYAVWGLLLLLVRRASTAWLLALAVFAAMARPVLAEVTAWWAWWHQMPLPVPPGREWADAVKMAAQHGSWPQLVVARWHHFLATTPGGVRGLLPDGNFTLFILGLLAIRHGVLERPLQHVRVIVGAMVFGFVSWAAAWTVLGHLPRTGVPGADWPLAYGLGLLQDQWLCLTYIGAVVLILARRPLMLETLAPVGWVGRMALTNYLLQAVVIDALASGYGAHLKLRPFLYLPSAIAFFGVLVVFSRAWLARFRYGPLEWIWRAATYARIPPLRPPAIGPASTKGHAPSPGAVAPGDSLE